MVEVGNHEQTLRPVPMEQASVLCGKAHNRWDSLVLTGQDEHDNDVNVNLPLTG